MITNPRDTFTLRCVRPVVCLLFFVAAGIAAFVAIGPSRTISAQGGQPGPFAAVSPATPECPPGSDLITVLADTFDGVTTANTACWMDCDKRDRSGCNFLANFECGCAVTACRFVAKRRAGQW